MTLDATEWTVIRTNLNINEARIRARMAETGQDYLVARNALIGLGVIQVMEQRRRRFKRRWG